MHCSADDLGRTTRRSFASLRMTPFSILALFALPTLIGTLLLWGAILAIMVGVHIGFFLPEQIPFNRGSPGGGIFTVYIPCLVVEESLSGCGSRYVKAYPRRAVGRPPAQ